MAAPQGAYSYDDSRCVPSGTLSFGTEPPVAPQDCALAALLRLCPTDYTPEPSASFVEDAQALLGPSANHDLVDPAVWTISDQDMTATFQHLPVYSNATASTGSITARLDVAWHAAYDEFSASALPQDQVIGPAPPALAAAPQPSGQALLTCPVGCDATFSRPGEYRRHMRKHGPRSFPCTQPGCTMAFYRKDKRRDHLRQFHKM